MHPAQSAVNINKTTWVVVALGCCLAALAALGGVAYVATTEDGPRRRTFATRVEVRLEKPPNGCLEGVLKERYGKAFTASDADQFNPRDSFGRAYTVPLLSAGPTLPKDFSVAFVEWSDQPYLEVSSDWVGAKISQTDAAGLNREINQTVQEIATRCLEGQLSFRHTESSSFPDGEWAPKLGPSL